jgi:putative hydrolase of the HAD superfamily
METCAKAILFDVNHTLIGIREEAKSQAEAVNVLYKEVVRRTKMTIAADQFHSSYNDAWKTGKLESFDKYRETKYESIVDRTLERVGVHFEPDELEEVLQIYMGPLYKAVYAIPGMLELLRSLRGRARLGAITNYKYPSGMMGLLRNAGITELLDAVVISGEVGWKKPEPAIYHAMLERLSVEAADCVLVGNELEKDLWQASKLGMTTVLVINPEHEWHDAEFAALLRSRIAAHELVSDFVVESGAELERVLNGLIC